MAEEKRKDLSILFPGRKLTIKGEAEGSGEIEVTVYPVGIRHLRKFTGAIGSATEALSGVLGALSVRVGEDGKPVEGAEPVINWGGIGRVIMPHLTGELIDIVNECVTGVDLLEDHLPHWVEVQILEAWIDESFGRADKVRPWIGAIEKLIQRVTKKDVQLWDKLSQALSQSDTPSTES